MKSQTLKVELLIIYMSKYCYFGKRPKLSQEKSGTMFFKARSQFFFGISKKILVRHKHNPQDFVKKVDFQFFF